jgi:hypothetical protein
MTRASEWLAGYEKAWRTEDPADVRAVFTDDAEYWPRPDAAEPYRGIDAILAMWPDDGHPEYAFEVLIEDDALGIVRGHVDYPGEHSYVNLWEVHFAEDGRARKFVEWFMTHKTKAPAAAQE